MVLIVTAYIYDVYFTCLLAKTAACFYYLSLSVIVTSKVFRVPLINLISSLNL